jgi:hypothetical protein
LQSVETLCRAAMEPEVVMRGLGQKTVLMDGVVAKVT